MTIASTDIAACPPGTTRRLRAARMVPARCDPNTSLGHGTGCSLDSRAHNAWRDFGRRMMSPAPLLQGHRFRRGPTAAAADRDALGVYRPYELPGVPAVPEVPQGTDQLFRR